MSDFIHKNQTYQGTSQTQNLRGLPAGAGVFGDWLHAFIARGYGWHVTIGAFSTGITGGGAGTVLDLDQPEGVISVPSGTTLIPIRISAQCHVPLLATDADESEILVAVDRAAAWAADGTSTAETAFNMRSDITSGCEASCASAFTADMTATTGADPVLGMELARACVTGDVQGTAANGMWTPLSLLYEPVRPPFLIGPCAIYLYWGGTVATPGYAQAQFLCVPSTLFTDLE